MCMSGFEPLSLDGGKGGRSRVEAALESTYKEIGFVCTMEFRNMHVHFKIIYQFVYQL